MAQEVLLKLFPFNMQIVQKDSILIEKENWFDICSIPFDPQGHSHH